MYEQKVIEEMEAVVCSACNHEGMAKRCPKRITDALVNANYGNIPQALSEFAEKLKKKLTLWGVVTEQEIDETLKEFLGE